MLVNLKKELENRGISMKDYADFLGISEKSARNKVNEETPLTYVEAEKTQIGLFPECGFLYLFASDKAVQKAGCVENDKENSKHRAVPVTPGSGKMSEIVKNSRVEIRSIDAMYTEIFVNGHKLRGVRSYKMEHHAGTFPKLTLEMNAWNFSIDENALLFAEGIGEIEIKVKEPSGDDSKA